MGDREREEENELFIQKRKKYLPSSPVYSKLSSAPSPWYRLVATKVIIHPPTHPKNHLPSSPVYSKLSCAPSPWYRLVATSVVLSPMKSKYELIRVKTVGK